MMRVEFLSICVLFVVVVGNVNADEDASTYASSRAYLGEVPKKPEPLPVDSMSFMPRQAIASVPLGQECNNYKNLSNPDRAKRAVTSVDAELCDRRYFNPGWYRFTGDAGDTIATSCVPILRCTSAATGWMNGSHPTNSSIVVRDVCFNWNENCCAVKVNIRVKLCGSFYIYELPPTEKCYLRYCGNAIGPMKKPSKCGGDVTSLSGQITSPGYPTFTEPISCQWTIKSAFDGNILLYFEQMKLGHGGCLSNNLTIDGDKTDTFCHGKDLNPLSILVAKSSVNIYYKSVYWNKKPGFKLRYLMLKEGLNNVPTQSGWIIRSVQVNGPSAIRVSWGVFHKSYIGPTQSVYGLVVVCKPLRHITRSVHAIAQLNVTTLSITGLTGNTEYQVQVVALVKDRNAVTLSMYGSETETITTNKGECENYRNLTSVRRSQNAPAGPYCDQTKIYTPAWYRFAGQAGTQIATSCVPIDRCFTKSPGWMDGIHPVAQDGAVMRTVCFHRLGDCCRWKATIRVRDCGGFYVYQLHRPPICKLGYCGNHGGCWKLIKDTTGTLISPGYPRRMYWNSKCLWDFTAPSSSSVIVVVVEDLRIPQSASCLKFSLSFKNNIGEHVGQACGVQRFFTWMSRESAKLEFISHQADSRWIGFKARYFIFNYDLTNIPVNSQWTNVSAQAMNSTATTVQWGPYRASPGSPSITEYIIICVPDGLPLNATVFTTDVSQNSLVVTGLMGYTSYTVQIVVQTNGKESGFNDYSGSQKTSVTTKEGVPSEGPSEIKVTNTSEYGRVKVSWKPIPKHALNGIITSFEIYYKNASAQTWSKLIVNNPVDLTAYLDGLEPGQYVLWIAGATSIGVGSKSRTISFTVGARPSPDEDIDMYLHGESTGDNMIPSTDDYFATCFRVNIPGDGFPFFNKRHHMIHICRNGLLLFETSRALRWPYRFAENRHWLRDASLLAPYWADIDPQRSFSRGISKVYYQAYNDTDNSWISNKMILQATYDVKTLHIDRSNVLYQRAYTRIKSFTAKWVLVITWVNLRPFGVDRLGLDLNNTFQAVLITDGIHSFAMYNYAPNGIQWSAPAKEKYSRYYKDYPGLPVVGWNVGRDEEERYDVKGSGQTAISGIDTRNGKTVNIDRLDVKEDIILRHGKWFFRLETAIPNRNSYERQRCLSWLQTAPDHKYFTDNLEPCPCTLVQAKWDQRFELDLEGWPFICAKSVFTSRQYWEQKCCYYLFTGALVKGYPGGGYPISSRIYTGRMKYEDYMYEKCCVSSNLCKSFYKKRPSDSCKRYRNPRWCWLWGDPHFVTLDGMNYTFNGLGEYIMADVSNGLFQLQARTKLAKGEGKATVFVSAVAKQNGTSAVQVNLKTGQGLEVLVNGSVIDHSTLTNSTTPFNGSVALSRPDDSSILLLFPSGISVKVTDVKDSLAILLAAPQRFKNKTRGLLGVWNDNPLDDLTTPTGHVLPTNATGRMIHYDFGQRWQVTESSSLFNYKDGENVNTFSNSSFEPMFIEDLKFANETLKREAHEKCEGDVNCLFDAASTNDVALGTSTKIFGSTFKNESNILKNSAPMFLNDSLVIYVTVNTTARIEIFARDDDGDPLTFSVSGILPKNLNINTDSSRSVVLSWKVTFAKVKFEITVMDDKGAAALLRPKVHVCACHNGGYCSKDANSNVFADSSNDTFLIMPCTCTRSYTGRFCENYLDACQANLNPCYPGVKCTDLPPPANGYKCGPCPQGFSGDGATCIDLDECKSGNDGCSQVCVNTPGSFVCNCNHGYRLSVNQKTCNDVDECYPSSDCMQKCRNTVGNYICECDEGFKVDPNNPKKCVPKDSCTDGNHGCQHICYMKDGQKQCACNQGYKLKDQKSCEDINECDPKIKRCSQYCNNTEGSYKCWCKKGFRLNADKITCKDVDECFELTYKCPDPSQICLNTEGAYKCICSQGLFLTANKTCREIDGPLPTKKPEPPKTPTENEKRNSVNITVQGLDVDDWFVELETKFKEAVAKAVTSYCASKTKDCKNERKRERRTLDYILYTADQVHLLPGFPKQMNPTSRDLAALIAFYVEFPPEIVSSSGDSIEGGILVKIVKSASAKAAIEKALNRKISSVTLYIMEQPTTPTPTTSEPGIPILYIIIGASVGSLILIVIVAVVIRKFVCKDRKIKDGRRAEERQRGVNNECYNEDAADDGETFGLRPLSTDYVVKQSSSNEYQQFGKENRGMDEGDYSDVAAEKPGKCEKPFEERYSEKGKKLAIDETSSKTAGKSDAEPGYEIPVTADADCHPYSKKLGNTKDESNS